jgi:hypothetical protein
MKRDTRPRNTTNTCHATQTRATHTRRTTYACHTRSQARFRLLESEGFLDLAHARREGEGADAAELRYVRACACMRVLVRASCERACAGVTWLPPWRASRMTLQARKSGSSRPTRA